MNNGRDVLAGRRNDEVLLAPGDREQPLVVEDANVQYNETRPRPGQKDPTRWGFPVLILEIRGSTEPLPRRQRSCTGLDTAARRACNDGQIGRSW